MDCRNAEDKIPLYMVGGLWCEDTINNGSEICLGSPIGGTCQHSIGGSDGKQFLVSEPLIADCIVCKEG